MYNKVCFQGQRAPEVNSEISVVRFPFRNRAARVDDYVETLKSIHKSFNLPYPAVNQMTLSAPLSPKTYARHGELLKRRV